MGGFWSTLGQVGEGIGQGMEQNAARKSPIFNGLYSAYNSNRINNSMNQFRDLNVADPTGQTNGIDTWDGSQPAQIGTDSPLMSESIPPPAPTPAPNPNSIPDSPLANHGQSNNESVLSRVLPVLLNAAEGTVVTKPTIAKLGEKEPEMVVPLHSKAANRIQPDILEGRISPPRVPGVHYSRYRSFNRLAPGQGGAL